MEDCKDLDILTITTTVGSLAAAQKLAREVVGRQLAACAQLESIQSVFHWQNKLTEEPEVRLTFKTVPECEGPLQALFADYHPYDVPQFISWRCAASAAYAEWVYSEVSVPSTVLGPLE